MKQIVFARKNVLVLLVALVLFALCPSALLAEEATEPYSEEDYAAVMKAVAAAQDVPPSEFAVDAGAAMLVEPITGTVIYEHNSDTRMFPASMTKLMTLTIALEAVQHGDITLEDEVSTSERAASFGGSQVYLEVGEVHTVHELLMAIAVGSANDASAALAEYIGGSYEGFVAMMNEKAQELGMTNTVYMNPHGLHDENHVTSAKDMMTLSLYAIDVPKLMDYTSVKETNFREGDGAMVLYNTNKLLFWYEGTDGLKTGTTSEAGRCLAATAERDGLRLVSVVMGGTVKNSHFSESMKLLEYGFGQFEMKKCATAGEILATVDVQKGRQRSVDLTIATPLAAPMVRGEEAEWKIEVHPDETIFAPLESGQTCGTVSLLINGKEMASVPLVAAQSVEKIRWYQAIGRFCGDIFGIE